MRKLFSRWLKKVEHRAADETMKPKPAVVSPYVLDLKNNEGALDRQFFDFPPLPEEAGIGYLRQIERWYLPPSYRTGLAFMMAVMFVTMLGITALEAQTMAESRRGFLNAQILQGFSELMNEWEIYSDETESPETVELTNVEQEIAYNSLWEDSKVLNNDPLPSLLHSVQTDQQTLLLELGLAINQGFQSFQAFLKTWESENYDNSTDKLLWLKRYAEKTVKVWGPVLNEANQLLDTPIFEDLENAQEFQNSLAIMADIQAFLASFGNGVDSLRQVLGAEEPQRILVFIQDSAQKRASGGALSVGLELLLDEGKLLLQRPFHVDEYDDLLRVSLQAPQGLSEISERWDLATANAFLDSEKSAEQIHWFWQREARSSVDLVLLINSSAIESLLDESVVTTHLDPESLSELEHFASRWSARNLEDDQEGLKSMMAQLLEITDITLKSPDLLIKIWPRLKQLASSKQIIVTSMDHELEQKMISWGLSHPLPALDEKEDVLMVASINTEDNASDSWIEESLTLHSSITDQGLIKHWLKIDRSHTWESSQKTALLEGLDLSLSNNSYSKLTIAENKSLIRVLVPKGSLLTAVTGVDLPDISSSTVGDYKIWSFESSLKAGKNSSIELFYELPWIFEVDTVDNYRLRILKQAGAKDQGFEHLFKLPADMTIFQLLPEVPIRQLTGNSSIAVVAGKNP